jgi:hypothetical protein
MKTCPKCSTKFPLTIIIDNKRRNLSKRKYCLTCSPFGKHNTKNLISDNCVFVNNGISYKKCPSCKNVLELTTKNYYMKKTGTFHYYCKICNDSKSIERKRKSRELAIQYKGGKCIFCGYNRYVGSMHFHHTDPTKKEFNISDFKTYDFEKLKFELDKCILMCSNCHGEVHGGLLSMPLN